MTAFTTTQIPATVNTVEKLAFWALSILQELNFDTVLQEQQNGLDLPVASNSIFPVRTVDFNGPRAVGRYSLPMSLTYAAQTRPWVGVQELSTTPIPSTYTT